MSPAFLGPDVRCPLDDRLEELQARLASVYRGDGRWLCGLGVECGFHIRCREDGTTTPRIVKELPDVTTERDEPGHLYCFCHNCEQVRRRSAKRSRWTEAA